MSNLRYATHAVRDYTVSVYAKESVQIRDAQGQSNQQDFFTFNDGTTYAPASEKRRLTDAERDTEEPNWLEEGSFDPRDNK